MTSKVTNRFSPEVRSRAARLVLDHEGEQASRWAAVSSIAAKIGCTGQTPNEWVQKAERDSGVRAGVPTDLASKLKSLERENRELRQANEILRKASAYFCDGGARPPVQAMIAFISPGLDPGLPGGEWGRAGPQGAAGRPVDLSRPCRQAVRSLPALGAGATFHHKIFLTVWDGGEVDSYDFSNYATDAVIDLAPGAWSTPSRAQRADLDVDQPNTHFARGCIANAQVFKGDKHGYIQNAIGGRATTGSAAMRSTIGSPAAPAAIRSPVCRPTIA